MLQDNLGPGSAGVVTLFSMLPESSTGLAHCHVGLHAGFDLI